MFKIYDGRSHFYQWDLDRKLIVNDPTVVEVHFCNRTDNCSLVCETFVEDGITLVNVPNILLQTDWKIRVYAWDGSHTKHDVCYEVKSRTKPADYVYTETEVKSWEETVEKVEALEKRETLKGSASGENVSITDASAAAHKLEVEVSPSNMFRADSAQLQPINFYGESKFGFSYHLPSGTYTISAVRNKPELVDLYAMAGDQVFALTPMEFNETSFTFTFGEEADFYVFDMSQLGIDIAGAQIAMEHFKDVNIELVISDISNIKLIQTETNKEFAVNPDGKVEGVYSTYPTINLYTDAPQRAANIKCIYDRDINKAFAELTNAIISLGGNV